MFACEKHRSLKATPFDRVQCFFVVTLLMVYAFVIEERDVQIMEQSCLGLVQLFETKLFVNLAFFFIRSHFCSSLKQKPV